MDTLDIVIIILAINTFILIFNTAFSLLMFFKKEKEILTVKEVREIHDKPSEIKRKKPMLAETNL